MKLDYDPNVKVQMIRPKNKYKSDRANSNKSNKRRLKFRRPHHLKTNLKKDNHDESNDD